MSTHFHTAQPHTMPRSTRQRENEDKWKASIGLLMRAKKEYDSGERDWNLVRAQAAEYYTGNYDEGAFPLLPEKQSIVEKKRMRLDTGIDKRKRMRFEEIQLAKKSEYIQRTYDESRGERVEPILDLSEIIEIPTQEESHAYKLVDFKRQTENTRRADFIRRFPTADSVREAFLNDTADISDTHRERDRSSLNSNPFYAEMKNFIMVAAQVYSYSNAESFEEMKVGKIRQITALANELAELDSKAKIPIPRTATEFDFVYNLLFPRTTPIEFSPITDQQSDRLVDLRDYRFARTRTKKEYDDSAAPEVRYMGKYPRVEDVTGYVRMTNGLRKQ